MSPGLGSIILVVVLIVLLFGRGKISALMGDLAKGITSFRKGLKEDSGETAGEQKTEEKSEEKAAAKSEEKPAAGPSQPDKS